MTKNNPAQKPSRKPHDSDEESIELRADGMERLRAAVRAAAKSGPKHRESKA